MSKTESSAPEKSSLGVRISAILITIVTLGLAAFFGYQLITKQGVFRTPGQIIFDETASTTDRDFITANLGEIELNADVTIATASSYTKLPADSSHVLYDILVPTTTFGAGISSITESEIEDYSLLSIWDLTSQVKLLAIDDQYYLDTFASGAVFQYYVLTGEPADILKVNEQLTQGIDPFPSSDTVLTFAQTGVTALSRGMNAKLIDTGNDGAYFAAKIGDFLSSFDLTHTSNEASFSDAAPTASHSMTICSYPGMVGALTGIGLDIVELTGNHNQDCGDQAALDTIDQYTALGIQMVGGGKAADVAAIPLEISEKGTGITMLAYNLSTGGYTLDNTPGANFYREADALANITAAKERGDIVIVDIQYYECSTYVSTVEDNTCDYADSSYGDQIGFFRSLIDMGADIVVGTAAHQPQTFELYHDGAIYYGLGNLFFDQYHWPGTTRSLVLVHYFYRNKLLQTRLVPTVYDSSFQTELMDATAAASFIDRLYSVRPKEP